MKIKGLSQYEDRSSDLDVMWLIKEVKAATSGIDKKIRPDGTEANDNYLELFKANVGVVELAHGRNVFCSHGIIQNQIPTSDDINIEEDRFKAMLLLKMQTTSDMVNFATG